MLLDPVGRCLLVLWGCNLGRVQEAVRRWGNIVERGVVVVINLAGLGSKLLLC